MPAYLYSDTLPDLRDALNFILQDLYSKLDFALHLDGKGIIVELKYGGMGRDVSAFDGLIYLTGGASGQLALGTGLVFDSTTGKFHLDVTTKGDILAGTASQSMARLGIGTAGQVLSVGGAHPTGLQWASVVLDTLYDANTILKADVDNTPLALTIAEQRLIGRITGGVITALTATEIRTLINVENWAVALSTVKSDADVASAISLKHTAGTDTALGAVGTKNPPIDADLALYRDSTAANALVTSTWTQVKAFLKTYFDTLYVAVTGRYRYAAAMADTTTITLPTITANYPAHGFIHCAHASTGVISASAEFEYGSTGAVQLIRGTANIEANGATAGKISIGAAVSANPVVIKNNLGGGVAVNVMITLWHN